MDKKRTGSVVLAITPVKNQRPDFSSMFYKFSVAELRGLSHAQPHACCKGAVPGGLQRLFQVTAVPATGGWPRAHGVGLCSALGTQGTVQHVPFPPVLFFSKTNSPDPSLAPHPWSPRSRGAPRGWRQSQGRDCHLWPVPAPPGSAGQVGTPAAPAGHGGAPGSPEPAAPLPVPLSDTEMPGASPISAGPCGDTAP